MEDKDKTIFEVFDEDDCFDLDNSYLIPFNKIVENIEMTDDEKGEHISIKLAIPKSFAGDIREFLNKKYNLSVLFLKLN